MLVVEYGHGVCFFNEHVLIFLLPIKGLYSHSHLINMEEQLVSSSTSDKDKTQLVCMGLDLYIPLQNIQRSVCVLEVS